MNRTRQMEALRRKLGFDPTRPDQLEEAFTHRSYAVENQLPYDNQRLEFLGDAVLEIILTDWIFSGYPDAAEGEMTQMRSALAQEATLAMLAQKLELGSLLRVGKGEVECGGDHRVSTLADLLESVIGALYLNAGFEVAKTIITELFRTHCSDPRSQLDFINPKGALQEYAQRLFSRTPDYQVLRVSGPEHLPDFEVEARLRNYTAIGVGHSRKAAETDAARILLDFLKKNSPPAR